MILLRDRLLFLFTEFRVLHPSVRLLSLIFNKPPLPWSRRWIESCSSQTFTYLWFIWRPVLISVLNLSEQRAASFSHPLVKLYSWLRDSLNKPPSRSNNKHVVPEISIMSHSLTPSLNSLSLLKPSSRLAHLPCVMCSDRSTPVLWK